MFSGSIQKGPKLERNKANHHVNQPKTDETTLQVNRKRGSLWSDNPSTWKILRFRSPKIHQKKQMGVNLQTVSSSSLGSQKRLLSAYQ